MSIKQVYIEKEKESLFKHTHPYPPFIPAHATKLIVGTLPPPRFTTGELKPGDIDFNYGSRDGQLWIILDKIFDAKFSYETSQKAIKERQAFLKKHHIGICDMVECAYREKIDATDIGIKHYELRNLLQILNEHTSIKTILFTGGNSKNGPEYFFRKHLKEHGNIPLRRIGDGTPKIHEFNLGKRIIRTVSLIAPSGSANRAVGSLDLYKKLKEQNSDFSAIDFRVMQYAPFFKDK